MYTQMNASKYVNMSVCKIAYSGALLSQRRLNTHLSMHKYMYVYKHAWNNYFNLALSSFSAPGFHQLVFNAYYLVLSFLLMYLSSGVSTDVFS